MDSNVIDPYVVGSQWYAYEILDEIYSQGTLVEIIGRGADVVSEDRLFLVRSIFGEGGAIHGEGYVHESELSEEERG